MKVRIFYLLVFILLSSALLAQRRDSVITVTTDSVTMRKNPAFQQDTTIRISGRDTTKVVSAHSPRKATLRSLVLPGWGQAYNKEYWKIPIVYGALGTVAGIYIFNNNWYKRTRDAYDIRVNRNNTDDTALIHPRLLPLSSASLQVYRNAYRRDRDYSMLWFIIVWGLNIADATVFGHLKEFDVSEDLSLRVDPILKSNGTKGIGLVLGFKPAQKHRVLTYQ